MSTQRGVGGGAWKRARNAPSGSRKVAGTRQPVGRPGQRAAPPAVSDS
eukprot:ctg_6987.g535